MNEKHDEAKHECLNLAHQFYGSVTVGERGQIVIPAEARQSLDLNPGDKLLVMRHPHHRGLMVFKLEAVREFLDEFAKAVSVMEGNLAVESS
jgi:AbrB family looped-hinge helix DNA binding protein